MNNSGEHFNKFRFLWLGESISAIGSGLIAFGLIGVISQFGYVAAYAHSGVLSDGVGKVLGSGAGRGSVFLFVIVGTLMSLTALFLYQIKSVKKLEKEVAYEL